MILCLLLYKLNRDNCKYVWVISEKDGGCVCVCVCVCVSVCEWEREREREREREMFFIFSK
jgi:hypothetical protein